MEDLLLPMVERRVTGKKFDDCLFVFESIEDCLIEIVGRFFVLAF